MQIRIKSLFRVALETVQGAANAFSVCIENNIAYQVARLHSVPVGGPKTLVTPQSLLPLATKTVLSPHQEIYTLTSWFARKKLSRKHKMAKTRAVREWA